MPSFIQQLPLLFLLLTKKQRKKQHYSLKWNFIYKFVPLTKLLHPLKDILQSSILLYKVNILED
jgi:hypothetical protein